MHKIVTGFVLLLFVTIQAQNKDEVLFTIADTPIYASEFIRVYKKNLELVQDSSQKDIDNYLQLFIDYNLKLTEAKAQNLDKDPAYLRELESYKKQLTNTYLTNSKITNALQHEAYNRLQYEINANHVLIRLPENALPKDTLLAYNQLLKFKNEIQKKGFETVQKNYHDNRRIYAEKLCYFTAFNMVYAFENAAYKTPVGELSNPFKTSYGYHIVQVIDKRKNLGKREVAQIFIDKKQTDAKNVINDIYKQIQQGEDFSTLAMQYSADKSTAKNGGKMPPFASCQLRSPIFEKVAFSLQENQVSKPFETEFGWHIIKLLKNIQIGSFAEEQNYIKQEIRKSSRSKVIDNAHINKLKSKYTITIASSDSIDKFMADFSSQKMHDDRLKNTSKILKAPFLTIENKSYSYANFLTYYTAFKQKNKRNKGTKKELLEKATTSFLEGKLLQYEKDNLENENKEYRFILKEYKDGLLLFNLMQQNIWNTTITDSAAIQEFYLKNKENYYFPKRVEAVLFSSASKKHIKKAKQLLEKGMPVEQVKKQVNTNNKAHIIQTSGVYELTNSQLPKNFKAQLGISAIYKNNTTYTVAIVQQVLPKNVKKLEEAEGQVVSDYQAYLEKKWMHELREKYPVVIQQNELIKIKKELKNAKK